MFKSWDEWHKAFWAAREEHSISGATLAGVQDPYFFIFDRERHNVLWSFDKYGVLEKWEKTNDSK